MWSACVSVCVWKKVWTAVCGGRKNEVNSYSKERKKNKRMQKTFVSYTLFPEQPSPSSHRCPGVRSRNGNGGPFPSRCLVQYGNRFPTAILTGKYPSTCVNTNKSKLDIPFALCI